MQPPVQKWLLPFLQECEFIYSFTSKLLLEPVELIIPIINNLSKGFIFVPLSTFSTNHKYAWNNLISQNLLFWSADIYYFPDLLYQTPILFYSQMKYHLSTAFGSGKFE